MKFVKNEEKYYEFIRLLRIDERTINGFYEQTQITKNQQIEYMKKYKDCYYVCLKDENPVGFIGQVNLDIRVATLPEYQGKGVGKFMVNELMKIHPKSIAKVKIDNIISLRLFISCGFIKYNEDEKFIYLKKTEYRKPKHNPFKVVNMFEEEVADYTGAPYAVSIDNCTNAIFLVCKYLEVGDVTIPSKTYLSVPQSIIHSGGNVIFDTSANDWSGIYQLKPYQIYDAAKRFTSNMYIPESYMCLSFHIKKHLKLGKGGMILTDNKEASDWFKMARYEGRSQKMYHEDDITMLGWNMYMTPQQASHGLSLMQNYPQYVEDLGENDGYRDLTEFTVFKKYKKI